MGYVDALTGWAPVTTVPCACASKLDSTITEQVKEFGMGGITDVRLQFLNTRGWNGFQYRGWNGLVRFDEKPETMIAWTGTDGWCQRVTENATSAIAAPVSSSSSALPTVTYASLTSPIKKLRKRRHRAYLKAEAEAATPSLAEEVMGGPAIAVISEATKPLAAPRPLHATVVGKAACLSKNGFNVELPDDLYALIVNFAFPTHPVAKLLEGMHREERFDVDPDEPDDSQLFITWRFGPDPPPADASEEENITYYREQRDYGLDPGTTCFVHHGHELIDREAYMTIQCPHDLPYDDGRLDQLWTYTAHPRWQWQTLGGKCRKWTYNRTTGEWSRVVRKPVKPCLPLDLLRD